MFRFVKSAFKPMESTHLKTVSCGETCDFDLLQIKKDN